MPGNIAMASEILNVIAIRPDRGQYSQDRYSPDGFQQHHMEEQ